MQGFGIALFIIFALIFVISSAFGIKTAVDYKKDIKTDVNHRFYIKRMVLLTIISAIAFPIMMCSIYIWNAMSPKWYELLKVILGGIVFATSLIGGIETFIIHYYRKGLPEKLDKWLFRILIISVATFFIAFLCVTDGFADYMGEKALLPNGINIPNGLVYPNNTSAKSKGGLTITFYALCILSGAVLVYFYCDHKHYIEYGRHGMLDSLFLIAFPAGIIGARIFYVIGNWNGDGIIAQTSTFAYRVAHGEWWSIFAIWEGGLTILGGAIVGIAVGIPWYIHKNKKCSIWRAVDIIVPAILVAQAIGRWGNFFNCEVHGGEVPSQYWQWLPRIVFNNAHYSTGSDKATGALLGWVKDPNTIYAPLFLVESMVNMLGFFVLAHVVDKNLIRKFSWGKPGDAAIGYVIWYGATRVFMEPLRHPSFNMGQDGYWSWFWSLIFVAGGILAVAINHIVRNILEQKKNPDYKADQLHCYIGSIITLVVAGILVGVGAYLMSSNPSGTQLALNGFNIGTICLVVGCSILICLSIPVSKLILNKVYKSQKEAI